MKKKIRRAGAMRKTLVDNKEAMEVIKKAIEIGMPLQKACSYAMVSKTALDKVLDRGERDVEEGIESKEADIYLEVEHSKAVFQVNNLEVLNKAGQSGSWQASAWLLERRCPEDFGNNRNKGEEVQRIQIVSDVKAEEDK